MPKRKHLQEIYGEEDIVEDPSTAEDSDGMDEVSKKLNKMITELKKKYGDDWAKHIGEGVE